jgi:hypothetical protein
MSLSIADDQKILLLWFASGLGLIAMLLLAMTRARHLTLAELRRSEIGGSYSIAILMVLPLFVTLLAFFIECNQLMLAKLGLGYATFSAARSAAAWQPIDLYFADSESRLKARCHLAAARTLTPFISGAQPTAPTIIDAMARSRVDQVFDAYQRQRGTAGVSRSYLSQKFFNACAATTIDAVRISKSSASAADRIAVTVTYRAPFLLPGIGRLLGEPVVAATGDAGIDYVRPMTTTVECPIDYSLARGMPTPTYSLGIRYGEPL